METTADDVTLDPTAPGTETGPVPEADAETDGTSTDGVTATSKVTSDDIPWLGKNRHIVTPTYSPVEILLGKLEAWLLQQPEWAYILAAPRKTRRQAVSLISKRLLTIPNRYGAFGQKGASNDEN